MTIDTATTAPPCARRVSTEPTAACRPADASTLEVAPAESLEEGLQQEANARGPRPVPPARRAPVPSWNPNAAPPSWQTRPPTKKEYRALVRRGTWGGALSSHDLRHGADGDQDDTDEDLAQHLLPPGTDEIVAAPARNADAFEAEREAAKKSVKRAADRVVTFAEIMATVYVLEAPAWIRVVLAWAARRKMIFAAIARGLDGVDGEFTRSKIIRTLSTVDLGLSVAAIREMVPAPLDVDDGFVKRVSEAMTFGAPGGGKRSLKSLARMLEDPEARAEFRRDDSEPDAFTDKLPVYPLHVRATSAGRLPLTTGDLDLFPDDAVRDAAPFGGWHPGDHAAEYWPPGLGSGSMVLVDVDAPKGERRYFTEHAPREKPKSGTMWPKPVPDGNKVKRPYLAPTMRRLQLFHVATPTAARLRETPPPIGYRNPPAGNSELVLGCETRSAEHH